MPEKKTRTRPTGLKYTRHKGLQQYDHVLEFIIRYKTENDGVSPTVREISANCGYGITTVAYALDRLEATGKIRRIENNNWRSIAVIGGSWSYQP